jgi:DNA-binding CsgD family transcriptional regulator
MKANLQSNVMSLDIGGTYGKYSNVAGNTSDFIYRSWNRMPDYALEYVIERERVSSLVNEHTRIPLAAKASGSDLPPIEPSSSAKIDAILTPRQRDVFELIVQGMSNKEIARTLGLAEGTVKIHIKALFAKLGVRRRAAVAVAGTRLLSTTERGSC